ncbi:hypothetical protein QUF90_02525 [Desulfococcaceae bacterium HSG9]|nr:hypothetical protein [Desulfococcaceae bacterium HSG9]
MESPRLVFIPKGKKIIITLYENPIVETKKGGFNFALDAPDRPIMQMPIAMRMYIVSLPVLTKTLGNWTFRPIACVTNPFFS